MTAAETVEVFRTANGRQWVEVSLDQWDRLGELRREILVRADGKGIRFVGPAPAADLDPAA